MNDLCPECLGSTVIAVRAPQRTSGFQIIECPTCRGEGFIEKNIKPV